MSEPTPAPGTKHLAPGTKHQAPSTRHGLLAGLIVVALGGAALWWFFGGGRGATRPTEGGSHIPHDRAITEVAPQIATNEAAGAKALSAGGRTALEASRENENTGAAETNATRPVIVNDGSLRPPDPCAALQLNCDKQIAMLIYAEPGQMIIGSVDFGEDFEKQFAESLKTKLLPKEDATEDEREMIAAVNEAKEAIVKAMRDEHKTAGEILSESREQLRKLWEYKSMLKAEISRYENDEDKTDDDVSDLFDAANRILQENNMPPFEPNDLTREVVRQRKFDKLEAQEEKERENQP